MPLILHYLEERSNNVGCITYGCPYNKDRHKRGGIAMEKEYPISEELPIQKMLSGHFARLNVNGKSEVCFVSGGNDMQTIDELIMAFGYEPKSVINERVIISIESVK